ncbi:MAG: hypothetical protein IJO73_06940 [Clostridia bacterium]|nr:hypothetical protein [Clostridia bacterium]
MKKRIASFVLIVIMLLSVFAVSSFAVITPGKPVYGKASGYGSKFTLTGNQANDVIAVAKAQVYKKGSELGYSFSLVRCIRHRLCTDSECFR